MPAICLSYLLTKASDYRSLTLACTACITLLSSPPVQAANCDYKAGPPDAGIATSAKVSGNSGIVSAWYGDATTLYTHGVLGDAIEAHTLYAHIEGDNHCALAITLDQHSVFEDVTPRIADVTGDGNNNVIAIESHINKGASLAIYGIKNQQLTKVASAPHIGKANRWLAPVGIADFNHDGIDDVAYVQTPHIGGILKIWSFKAGEPTLLASKAGFSNHKIGQNFITGGIRNCGANTELVLPNQQWSQTLIASVNGDSIKVRPYAPKVEPNTVEQAINCKN